MKGLNYNELIDNNLKWIDEKLSNDKDYFKKLSRGQSPKYLMIGCSDSRIPLSTMLKAEPGEIFIHRNIANQISATDMNLLSVLEYSVDYLNVKHIIITGHYHCGGVAAAIDGIDQGLVENWISPIKNLYSDNYEELSKIKNRDKMADRLSEINVLYQVENLLKIPTIQRAFKRGQELKVYPWIFNIYNGKFIEMPMPIEKWKKEGLLPENY